MAVFGFDIALFNLEMRSQFFNCNNQNIAL